MRAFHVIQGIRAAGIAALMASMFPTPLLAEGACPSVLPPGVQSCKVVRCSSYRLPALAGDFTCLEARYSKPPPGKKRLIRYRYNGPSDWVIEFYEFDSDGKLVPGLLETLQDGKFCFQWGSYPKTCIPFPPSDAPLSPSDSAPSLSDSPPLSSQGSSWEQER